LAGASKAGLLFGSVTFRGQRCCCPGLLFSPPTLLFSQGLRLL
jgi:hypothetical protein